MKLSLSILIELLLGVASLAAQSPGPKLAAPEPLVAVFARLVRVAVPGSVVLAWRRFLRLVGHLLPFAGTTRTGSAVLAKVPVHSAASLKPVRAVSKAFSTSAAFSRLALRPARSTMGARRAMSAMPRSRIADTSPA